MQKQRIGFIDVMKGITILCVILGHCFAPYGLKTIIYSFHVPCFFLLSGFFWKSQPVWKRFKHLIVPYLITSIVMLLITLVNQVIIQTGGLYGQPSSGIIWEWLAKTIFGSPNDLITGNIWGIGQIGPIWFFEALFWADIEMEFIMRIRSESLQMVTIFFVVLLSYIISRFIWLPFNILNGLSAVIFVFAGKKLSAINNIEKFVDNYKFVLCAVTVSLVTLICYHAVGKDLSLSRIDYPLYGFDVLGAFSGSYIIAYISRVICKIFKYIEKILRLIGQSTLEILSFHTIDIECLSKYIVLNGMVVTVLFRIMFPVVLGVLFHIVFFKFKEVNKRRVKV